MSNFSPQEQEFLDRLNAEIEKNLASEQFGVSELADTLNMSRSNLLRKVKKLTGTSVTQLISQVRLKRAMVLLKTTTLNVTEVSRQVGFGSTSYFIKCFREYYGFPPGEAGKRDNVEPIATANVPPQVNKRWVLVGVVALGVAMAVGWWSYQRWFASGPVFIEKSVVVLPFRNESSDSANVYLINGLMEATLNNLQKIKDLRVLSRTSAEKYRNSSKAIPEMARELNASYFVEGSGQKIGDRIVLNIQLIDGATDRHLWSRQYRRETSDIFALQHEISKDIAEEIQAVITPDEKSRLERVQTQNASAYDSFLKGLDLLNKGGNPNLEQALVYFDNAIEEDKQFALAHALGAITCYYLDVYKQEQAHLGRLGTYADKALLLDPALGESYLAKAMYYLVQKQYKEALPFLEKALEYNPNSTQILGQLADFYSNQLPNTGRYLEYALKGLQRDINSGDSVSISYFHLRLANALIQSGFVDESLKHLDISLQYFPNNAFARYVRAFVLYAKDGDLRKTRSLLVAEFNKDTTRFDILQDIGKVSYYLADYDSAYQCYKRFNSYRERHKLDVYQHENMLIGKIYEKMGEKAKAQQFYESHRQHMNKDQTIYKNLALAFIYCQEGNSEKALEYLRLFAKEDNVQYWVILFLNKAPDATEIEKSTEFRSVMREVERKFWANHEKLKRQLTEQGLI